MADITIDDTLAVIRAHCAGQERSIRLEDAEGNEFDLGQYKDGDWQLGAFDRDGPVTRWRELLKSRTLEECILEAKRRGLLG